MKQTLKAVRSAVVDHPAIFRLRRRREAHLLSGLVVGADRRPDYHVLLPSSSEVKGSVGDQAMVQAFVENVASPIVIVKLSHDDDVVPVGADEAVTAVSIPGLVDGSVVRTRETLSEFGRLLEGAASFSVIGADVIDGAYSYRRSVQRITAAMYAARAGVDTRILGFSWNERPDPRAAEALREAARAGVRVLVRDPVSERRLRAVVGDGVMRTADLVFSARSVDETVREGVAPGLDAPFVVLNANGLIGRTFDQAPDYLRLVDWVVSRGLQVVLVPHDSRRGVEDVAECRRIFERCPAAGSSVFLVDRLLRPHQIRGLLRGAECVLSGRMHLSIMALWSGVPAVTLAYQGKVEGLMEMFDTPSLTVAPAPGFADRAIAVLEDVLAERSSYRAKVASGLERARALSRNNFSGLPLRDQRAAEATA